MVRSIIVCAMCLALAGCWMSERRFFGENDWAHPDIQGLYEVEMPEDRNSPFAGTLTSRDGLFTMSATADGKADEFEFGLVSIAGGSGEYYILVPDPDTADEGQLFYLLRHSARRSLEIFAPSCEGTPAREGLDKTDVLITGGSSCIFRTRGALMSAALEAERFLSAAHIVEIEPTITMTRHEALPVPEVLELPPEPSAE